MGLRESRERKRETESTYILASREYLNSLPRRLVTPLRCILAMNVVGLLVALGECLLRQKAFPVPSSARGNFPHLVASHVILISSLSHFS